MDPESPTAARAPRRYRDLLAEHGMSWGEPLTPYVRSMSHSRFCSDARLFEGDGDFDAILRDSLHGEPPDGLAVLRLVENGHRLDGGPWTVLGDRPLPMTLLVDNRRAQAVRILEQEVAPGGARLFEIDARAPIEAGGRPVTLARRAEAAPVRLRAGFPCRWSVWSEDGQGWYPEGAPRRRDSHDLPYFHGDGAGTDRQHGGAPLWLRRGVGRGVSPADRRRQPARLRRRKRRDAVLHPPADGDGRLPARPRTDLCPHRGSADRRVICRCRTAGAYLRHDGTVSGSDRGGTRAGRTPGCQSRRSGADHVPGDRPRGGAAHAPDRRRRPGVGWSGGRHRNGLRDALRDALRGRADVRRRRGRGSPHPRSMFGPVFAHTSPVYLDVDGRGVARAQDVRWCPEWLDLLEELIRDQAVLRTERQLEDHLDLLRQARAVYRGRLST